MFVQTFLDFVSQKALSIVIADGCECNALSVSNWMKMGKCFPFFLYFKMIIILLQWSWLSCLKFLNLEQVLEH